MVELLKTIVGGTIGPQWSSHEVFLNRCIIDECQNADGKCLNEILSFHTFLVLTAKFLDYEDKKYHEIFKLKVLLLPSGEHLLLYFVVAQFY